MKTNKMSLLITGFVILTFTIPLSSCSDGPFVSRTETVETFNSSRALASALVHGDLGYEKRYENHFACRLYKYVLFDDYVKCPVVKSANPVFKTESNDQNGPIHKSDICIDCGYAWRDHEKW